MYACDMDKKLDACENRMDGMHTVNGLWRQANSRERT